MERQDYIDELLVKDLLGEADDAQSQYVANWRKRSRDNERYYEQFSQIWEQSKQLQRDSTLDVDAAWNRFRERVAVPEKLPERISVRRMHTFRIAASLLLLLGGFAGGRYWWTQQLTVSSGTQVITQQLPDGSAVTLNKNTQLVYPRHFSSGNRTVTLKGEAFFSVAPDKQHPFIITANDVVVKVVGTSFNVKSDNRRTEVIVESGLVDVSNKNQHVRVAPRERALVESAASAPVKAYSNDKLYNYYRTHEFICDHTPLSRLVSVLSEVYGVQISVADPEKAAMPITATFKNERLNDVLTVVSETLGLTVEQRASAFILH
ncbi:FecR family protein [Rurimicrobium arvi]|uniref:FecR family protein n=1 Tax=Rurimicrobium arvi TaxID=2049916 RepID=UPI0031DB9551